MILGKDIKLPDDSSEQEEVSDKWKKQQRHEQKCKEAAWKKWFHEYLAALRERETENLNPKEKQVEININDVVVIKRHEKNRGKWKIGIIENIFMGTDNTIRSVRIRTRKSIIERPIQLLYPVDLYCDSKTINSKTQVNKTLNVGAEEFRAKRSAAAVAEQGIIGIKDNENQ